MFSRCFLSLKGNLSIPKFSNALSSVSSQLSQDVVTRPIALLYLQGNCFQHRQLCTAVGKKAQPCTADDNSSFTSVKKASGGDNSLKVDETKSFDEVSTSINIVDVQSGINESETVYLRGLPYYCTEQDILEFFKTVGAKPTNIILKYDRLGKTNGKAEVMFEGAQEVQKALKKHNAFIGNRYIEVATEPFIAMNAERVFTPKRDNFRERPVYEEMAPTGSSNSVRLSGLPYSVTVEDIRKFFEPLNITPVNIDLKYSNGRPTGFCNVKFESKEDAVRSLGNNNAYIGSRYIRVALLSEMQSSYQGRFFTDRRKSFQNEQAFQHVEDDNVPQKT